MSAAKLIDKTAMKLLEKIYDNMRAEIIPSSAIADYTRALKNLKEIAGVKSELDIKEQKARIANLERQAESDHTKDTTYTVVIGNAKDYVG